MDERMNGWMDGLCATGDAPEQYLCDKGWHRWWPRAGVQSTKWHAITGPDGLRLSVLFLLLNRRWINSEKGRGVKKQREKLRGGREERQQPAYKVRKVKEKDVEEMWECEKGNVINKSIKLTFHLPTFWVLRSKKSTSCIFKRDTMSHLQSQITKVMPDVKWCDWKRWL